MFRERERERRRERERQERDRERGRKREGVYTGVLLGTKTAGVEIVL